jgi:hypothetical protein
MTDYTILTIVYLCHNGMSHLKIFYGCSNQQLVLISLTKIDHVPFCSTSAFLEKVCTVQ